MEPLLPQPGSSLDPRNAVGRHAVTQRARTEIFNGNNLGLNDPRRMGKTVWLDMFCADPGDGLLALKIDYEGVHSSEQFLQRTVEAVARHERLPSKAMNKLRTLFDGIEVAGPVSVKVGLASRTPTELLEQTMHSVEEHLDQDVTLVVAMDEVPIAIANIAERQDPAAANHLLQTLRSLRRRGSRLRWIVCGSIGFHHVLRHCGATEGVLNDLVNLPLGPLEADEADELARRLLLGIERSADEAAIEAMVEQSGSIPFLLHHLAHRLHDAGVGAVTASDVDDAFVAFMDDRDDSRAATHLVSRIEPLYGERAAPALALLDRLATGGMVDVRGLGVPADLVDDLVDDHYLVERSGTVGWRYDVLRRIWVHRRKLG